MENNYFKLFLLFFFFYQLNQVLVNKRFLKKILTDPKPLNDSGHRFTFTCQKAYIYKLLSKATYIAFFRTTFTFL